MLYTESSEDNESVINIYIFIRFKTLTKKRNICGSAALKILKGFINATRLTR